VGEVLADAASLLEEFHDRRCDGRRAGVELELSMNLTHERSGCLQNRKAGLEAIACVSSQVSFYPHIGRFKEKVRGFDNRGIWAPGGTISECFAHRFPGGGFMWVRRFPSVDHDG